MVGRVPITDPVLVRHPRGSFMAEDDSSPQKSLGEIFELTKAYAKQETIDPIKGLGKFIGFGLGAAVLGSLSVGLLIIGVLRLLQSETGEHLTGSLTWVPYLITLVITVIVIAIAVTAIARKKDAER